MSSAHEGRHRQSVATVVCGHCSQSLPRLVAASRFVVCSHCRRTTTLEGSNARASSTPLPPLSGKVLAIGTEIPVDDKRYRVAALTQYRDSAGKIYTDYDLARSGKCFLSLEDEQTEWTLNRPLEAAHRLITRTDTGITYAGESFAREAEYTVTVYTALGEFEDRPAIGDVGRFAYYEGEERGLEAQLSPSGEPIEWYLSSEFDAGAIRGPTQPSRRGAVAGAQFGVDSNASTALWRWAFVFALAAVAVHLAFAGIARDQLVMDSGARRVVSQDQWQSGPHALEGRTSNVLARVRTTLDNQWLHLTLTLTNTETGKWYRRSENIGYYHGWEGGERWSEGGRSPDLYFSSVPAGTYLLEVEAASDVPVEYAFTLHRDVPRGDYLLYAVGAIFAVPLLSLLKRMNDR